jgi:hypothetical protein
MQERVNIFAIVLCQQESSDHDVKFWPALILALAASFGLVFSLIIGDPINLIKYGSLLLDGTVLMTTKE